MKAYTIKPLEWINSPPEYAEVNHGCRWASAGIEPFGFNIWGDKDGTARFTDEHYSEGNNMHASWDEAVSAAVEWYTQKVTSFLEPITEKAQ